MPGDLRGWYERHRGLREPDALRQFEANLRLTESAYILDLEERRLVEKTIVDHCAIRSWILHAVNCRSNHVHVVVTAPDRSIEVPREQFKAWCTRRLKERQRSRELPLRENWWTERGWDEYLDDEKALADVMAYVIEGQGPR